MRTRRSKPDEYQTPPELMIESAMRLLSTVPSERRAAGMRELAERMKEVHAGLPLPAWIGMLSDLADREGSA